MHKFKYYLLLAVPFLIFVFYFNFPAPPWPDQIAWDSVAREFLKTGIFRYPIGGDFMPSNMTSNFNHGPLYSFVHLVILKIFGSDDFRYLVGLNYLLALLSIINVGRILKLEGRQNLLLAILAFNPLIYHFTNIARPEWVSVFLLSCLWRVLASRDKDLSYGSIILAGFLLTLFALNHQFAIFFVPFAIYAICMRATTWRKRFSSVALLVASTFVFFSPYLYYVFTHFADFKEQLIDSQMDQGIKRTWFSFIKNLFVPFFSPSVTIFTETGKIPRWQASIPPIAFFIILGSVIIKVKRKLTLSPITIEAALFWLSAIIGCLFSNYNIYISFSSTIFAIALIKDVAPEISPKMVKGIVAWILLALAYQFWFYGQVSSKLFKAEDYFSAVKCLSEKIPANETVYVMAHPDPSVQLNNFRNDLQVKRYSDYKKFAPEWEKVVEKNSYFILSPDGKTNRFDFNDALKKRFENGEFKEESCVTGNIAYRLLFRANSKNISMSRSTLTLVPSK